MKTYLDGSSDAIEADAGWLTLAGFSATDALWDQFEQEWGQMLLERYPIAPYIHMAELIYGDDPFETVAGWTAEKKDELIIAAVELMRNLDKERFRWFTCHIDLTARTRLLSEGYAVMSPYEICADICVANSMEWFYGGGLDEPMYLFFDRGERFMSGMKAKWLESRTPPGKPKYNPTNVWDWIADIQEQDMKNRPGLQAADMMAWSCTRSSIPLPRYWAGLRQIMQTVLRGKAVRVDERAMREKSAKLKPE